jgi:ABC-type oligopeptide transport system ATPase subunit
MALTEVRDLRVRFVTREATVHAVNGVSFAVQPGEVLCILGESGSGKSITLRALMRLLPPRSMLNEAEVSIDGQDILAKRPQALRDLRGGLAAMIFQEPMTALDPVYTPADRRSGAPPYRLWLSRGPRAHWSCRSWCESCPPSGGSTPIRTNYLAACASGR